MIASEVMFCEACIYTELAMGADCPINIIAVRLIVFVQLVAVLTEE